LHAMCKLFQYISYMSKHQEPSIKTSVPGNLKNRGFKSKSMDTSPLRKPCPCTCRENWLLNIQINPCTRRMTKVRNKTEFACKKMK
jgi:hypothetical protein